MSAFFFAMNRDGSNFDYEIADSMMSQLDGFGDDFSQLVVKDHFAIAYQATWYVPEEVGEQQPLKNDNGEYFVFLGRLDNRAEIIAALCLSQSQTLSDAQLIWAYVLRFGADRLNDIIGPYVFIAFDARTNDVLFARDPMGGRHLIHRICNDFILIATYEMALVAHPNVPYQFNSEKVARSLAMQLETKTLGCIDGLKPVEPGVYVQLTKEQETTRRFYKATPNRRIRFDTDQAYAREFRRLLKQAVARRLRSTGQVATMMSGGLDSVPIAIAASQLESQKSRQHHALSWVFDRFSEADERKFSEPVCCDFSILQHQVNCDEVWPKFDHDTDLNPVNPFNIPYSEFQQETFRRAQKEGINTILTGIHGDILYGHTHSIIYELVGAGQWRRAMDLFKLYWQETASKPGLLKNLFLKPIRPIRFCVQYWRRIKPIRSPIMADDLQSKLKPTDHVLEHESRSAVRPRQWQNIFDGTAGSDMALGRAMEAKYSIDRRYPMRDRDLCEFMAAIPSTQLIDGLTLRPIVLNAFSDELPNMLKQRNTKTSFESVISAQIADDKNAKYWLSTSSNWQRYVKHCYFDAPDEESAVQSLVQWRCAYYNFWQRTCYDQKRAELSNHSK